MKHLFYILLLLTCWSCSHRSENAKVQNERRNIVNVKELVKEIIIEEDVLIGGFGWPSIIDNYLIIDDSRSADKMIHIFDKNTFKYINSFANRGQGPGEIANLGHTAFNKDERLLYVTDHGKQCIFSYPLDSVLVNPDYLPETRMRMDKSQFPGMYYYINDTLCIGKIIEPIGNNNFKPTVGKWNMNTGEINLMKYEHPGIEKKRTVFDISVEHGIYAEGYLNHDLMTICDLDGNLKYNIYGSGWNEADSKRRDYFGNSLAFCGNRIIALFSGEYAYSRETKQRNFPTKLLVFNLDGDYLRTLETGYRIVRFCYDRDNNRLILNCDDEIQFGYLDLDKVNI